MKANNYFYEAAAANNAMFMLFSAVCALITMHS